ncbi:hypothetical protein [Aminobacter aminovorans]|uniref:hypothetical protein n=1 Tax=Aminobacter aminovorans TaxID=83263 RepID=UPI002862A78A|nr:hypothetical protein [Aminobacter aminovorans]MDR7221299.1 hypothetical protein [Aminobacter aminovorans]
MLRAIIEGKGRRLPASVSAGDSLKRAFVQSEDILTATVFGRLAYLDGPLFWEILKQTFRPQFLPAQSIVEIDDVEFWPTWGQAKGTLNKAVEPDVVIRLTAGDPPQSWALIVECKYGGGAQSSQQWYEEWTAYLAESAAIERADQVWLLAIGGHSPKGVEATVTELSAATRTRHGIDLRVAGAEWSDLVKTLNTIEIPTSAARRVIADIRKAFDLHGFRQVRPLSDLVDLSQQYKPSGALTSLRSPHTDPETATTDFDKWAAKSVRWRPVSEHQILRLR